MKKTTMLVITIALSGASLLAQQAKLAPPVPAVTRFEAPMQAAPDTLVKIFSNLGPASAAYVASGYYVAGPVSALGQSQFMGLPFTPAKNSTAQQLRAAISWNATGANRVRLSLYSDAGGVPGTLLAGPVTKANLPAFGTCCTIVTATIPATALTAGTQYWIVADTVATGTGSDSEDVWNSAPQWIAADVAGGGWFNFVDNNPAGAVYGTIP